MKNHSHLKLSIALVLAAVLLALTLVSTLPTPQTHINEAFDSEPLYTQVAELRSLSTHALQHSLFNAVRFKSEGDGTFFNEYHSDGRSYPIGHFIGYFHNQTQLQLRITDARHTIHNYEPYLPASHHLLHALGQLPWAMQALVKTVEIEVYERVGATFSEGLLRISVDSLSTHQAAGTLYRELIRAIDFTSLIDLAAFAEAAKADARFISVASQDSIDDDLAESFWAIFYTQHQVLGDELGVRIQAHIPARFEFLNTTLGFMHPDQDRHDTTQALPFHDTMNIATNPLYVNLITVDDPSWFESAEFVGLNNGEYEFLVRFSFGHRSVFLVEATVSQAKAQEQVVWLATMFGQAPQLLLRGLGRYSIKQGSGYGGIGDKERLHGSGMQEETLLHDLSHITLDWPRGLITRDAWLEAARKDDFYISHYARDFPEREDIAETIIYYLVTRWRSDRFDSIAIEYMERAIPHRLALLDQFDWGFPY
jgi:hypothetical protein